jgi:hypothetical protein
MAMAMAMPMADEITPGLLRMEKVASSGWSWNMFLVRLRGGGLLVHSPIRFDGDGLSSIDAIGTPRVIFAPNHFHNAGLPAARARWPNAIVVASEGASPRLSRQRHEGIRPLEEAIPLLPDGARFLPCEGTKTGETFLSLPPQPGERGPTWIACDAFFHVTRAVRGTMGMMLRAMAVVPGLRVSRTFRYVAVRDARAYVSWLEAAIEREAPFRLVVSHGEALEGDDLGGRLLAATRDRLG